MSWLNLNDSLNNLKGQITNFASGVLAEGIVNDSDSSIDPSQAQKKIEELQNLCASQEVEIATLRRQNADFYEKLSSKSSVTTNSTENGDSWFWDPPTSEHSNTSQEYVQPNSTETSDKIRELTTKIQEIQHENEKLQKQIRVDSIVTQNYKDRISELEKENKELVQNLEQLDLDCQNTTDKLVTLKDNLQSEVTKLKTENETLKQEKGNILKEREDLGSQLKNRNHEIDQLKLLVQKLQLEIDSAKPTTDSKGAEVELTELKTKLEASTAEKETITKKLISNQQLISNLQTENSEIKSALDRLKEETVPLENHKKLNHDFENLQKKFAELEQKNKDDQEKIYKLNNDFKELKLHDNSNLQINLSDDHKKLQDMFEELKLKYDSVIQEVKEMHKKYVGILTETVKKFVDHELPEEFTQKPNETALCSEFTSKVEATLKLLLDYKWKTETLEKKLCEITQEKTASITEKNHEIEKLLHNSEILSQEVITKTQIIKDYEIECTELIKNNDLLIAELQQYKNNNGLTTISESNEDNLLLMETQLENSNKRIKELELIISDMENAKQDTVLETQTELDYIKKQLNMTGNELSQSKKEYQDLLKSYKEYETENNNLVSELNTLQLDYEKYVKENQEYLSQLEKTQSELENMEYKYIEAQTEKESIAQDLSSTKENEKVLIDSNSALTNQVQNLNQEISVLRNQFESQKEVTVKLEEEVSKREKSYQNLQEKCNALATSLETVKTTLGRNELNFDQLEESLAALRAEKLNRENDSITTDLGIKLEELEKTNANLRAEVTTLTEKLSLEQTKFTEQEKLCKDHEETIRILNSQGSELSSKLSELQKELSKNQKSNAELLGYVQAKHNENVQYHTEIQRLNSIIAVEAEKYKNLEAQLQTTTSTHADISKKDSEIEKLRDQNNFLKEKCEKLAQSLLEEQSNQQKILGERQVVLDREQQLAKELERLRQHLVEIEETYTQELLLAEQRNQEMQGKVNEIEQRERDSSTIYTSVSIRANQQVETLQNQLQLVTVQRDELQNKLSEAEDKNNKQYAALTNLQCVLEQFQKDKEIDIGNETERIRRQLKHEKDIQNQMQTEINTLKAQLQESKQGLLAASRLSEQLERSKQQVVMLKDEVLVLQDSLKQTEEKYKSIVQQTDAKVDKALIKNLVVGFVGANNNLNKDQTQILKIISTVLDFSQQDNEKLKLNKQPGSWLSSILHPQMISNNSEMSQQSLSEAFVRFLETESQPKKVAEPGVTLLNVNRSRKSSETSNSSKGASLLNEVVLPTFADFAQSRSSSAILKDVLKDNN